MIISHLPLGEVTFTGDYFATLVSEAAKHCYGVAGMACGGVSDTVKDIFLRSKFLDKGVRVTTENDQLVIELHLIMSYGVNISTASKSITHRVHDEVEQATGLKVARVTVYVDDILG